MAADIYNEAAGARPGGRGTYLRSGRYTLLVDKIHERDTRGQAKGGLSVIAEFVVIAAAASGEKDERGAAIEPNPPGSSASVVINFTKHPETAPGNLKAMVLGILEGRGATEDKVTADVLRVATSAKNPLRGHLVAVETTRIVTKEKRITIDIPSWKGIAQTKEQVAAARDKLDARRAGTDATAQAPVEPAPQPAVKEPDPAPRPAGGDSFLDMLD